ncbi:MAG: type II toxin-antitoxin system VapC family toxin [Candidatus Diapherotrites archaeon]|nr:type II toxin-antitoxin system VapC family toxin [Candidatus Diapherotrites archaeon]
MDASVAVHWFLDQGERTRISLELLKLYASSELKIYVPVIFFLEVINAVRYSIPPGNYIYVERVANYLERLSLPVVNEKRWLRDIVREIGRCSLTAYDATYLTVAQKKRTVLLSYDKQLLRCKGVLTPEEFLKPSRTGGS